MSDRPAAIAATQPPPAAIAATQPPPAAIAATQQPAAPGRPPARLPLSGQVALSLLWFALFANWLTVVPVIVPDQVARMLGPAAAQKEGISGTILAIGALMALIMAPVAGALSDRGRSPGGRRRRFLIAGMIGACIGLALLVPAGASGNLMLYLLAYVNLQFWWNWACGPYAGLIPDVVPAAGQARASAWMNIMSILGTFTGNGIAVALYSRGRPALAIAALVAVNLACLGLTLRGVHEPPGIGASARRRFEMRAFLRSFWLSPAAHGNFYRVLVSRLFANLGVWSVLTFLLYYLRDVIGVAEPGRVLPMLLGSGALLGIPASLLAARLADRYGVVGVVRAANWLMAAAALAYVLIAFHPGIAVTLPVFLIFFAGWGAYQAVDWALALKVLPKSADAGKDMGIWHVALVLPQIVGPALTGWLITGARLAVSARFAYALAFAIAALWFSLSAVLIARVRLPQSA